MIIVVGNLGNDRVPKVLEEIEKTAIPGLVEVLREEGIDAVRYVLWDATGWHRDYSPPAWRNRATKDQKRRGWEIAVRIEKILCTVLHEPHERQVEETMRTLSEGPEGSTEGLFPPQPLPLVRRKESVVPRNKQ